ncbi:hypothetical protein XENTR_v10002092 [Xenopus tropicalis]|nr:hypothetical protein XENTR_v10002092 [Xenopus tropicalis]
MKAHGLRMLFPCRTMKMQHKYIRIVKLIRFFPHYQQCAQLLHLYSCHNLVLWPIPLCRQSPCFLLFIKETCNQIIKCM